MFTFMYMILVLCFSYYLADKEYRSYDYLLERQKPPFMELFTIAFISSFFVITVLMSILTMLCLTVM